MDQPDWIGHLYVSEFGWNVLEDIALNGPRLGGSPGERRAHDRVKQAFREAGLREISEEEFPIPRWERRDARIEVEPTHHVKLDCIALPKSPVGDVEAEFVYLNHGLLEDFRRQDVEGKIAIVRSDVPDWYEHWLHRLVKYRLAVRHGAVGFIFANHVEGYLPPTGSVGVSYDTIGEIPAIGVSKEVGENVRRLIEREGSVRGRVTVDAEIQDATSQNVFGVVGPDTDEEIVLGAHVDAHDIGQGANDNGTGVAIMCETARALSKFDDQLETQVRFVGFGAEEHGMAGSSHYAAGCDPDHVKLAINLDSLGKGRKLQIHDNCFEGVADSVRQLRGELAHPFEYRREFAAYSDHWPFVSEGIPGIMISAASGHKGRGYVHTYADTLDKIDIRAVRDHSILITRLVMLLARRDVEIPERSRDEIRADLRRRGLEKSLRLAGDWPED